MSKVLIIEDDDDILSIMEYMLKDEGYEVVLSADGGILADLNSIKPDLILLDEWLAAERGSDLCRQIKSKPATASIPVVLVSGLMHLETVAREAGADGYIQKPFDVDNFNKIISAIVQPG